MNNKIKKSQHNFVLIMNHKIVKSIIILCGLILIYIIMLSRFNLSLLFTKTILTGGDSASWFQPLLTLRNEYLPRFRFFAYNHANFFGYLEGQQYFPLPFLAGALLSYIVEPEIALKLITILACFLLPLTSFIGICSITKNALIGLIGAALSLLFLFNESYSMFGGNFLSTFAGEFCYSWAIALLPIYIASVWKNHALYQNLSQNIIWKPYSGILLGLIGLCHIFVFMVAAFLPLFFIYQKKYFFKQVRKIYSHQSTTIIYILLTYLIAFLLMAFWVLPMISTRMWAQSITMIWSFNDFFDFIKQTLFPVCLVSIILLINIAFFSIKNRKDYSYKACYILYNISICIFLFISVKLLGVADIRFVPPALICSIFAVCLFISEKNEEVFKQKKIILYLTTLFIIIGNSVLIPIISKNSSAWFDWNYTGYQSKKEWNNLLLMRNDFSGTIETGRLLWEKQNQYDNIDFGSERGFENIYYFFGRPSTEGIHYGSSFMARATTYLQSSYSLNPVDPETERLYSQIDSKSWALRFTQANAQHIVLYSDRLKKEFIKNDNFEKIGEYGKFWVFKYKKFPSSYIDVLDTNSISIINDSIGGFKTDFYRFFRDYELVQYPFIPKSFMDKKLRKYLKTEYKSYDEFFEKYIDQTDWNQYANIQYIQSKQDKIITNEKIDNFTISFETNKLNYPHIIKCSYAPGWKSKNGEKIYPISPGFMVVFPETSNVRLKYIRSNIEWIGLFCTFILFPFFLFLSKYIHKISIKSYLLIYRIIGLLLIIVIISSIFVAILDTGKIYSDVKIACKMDLQDIKQRKYADKLISKYINKKYLEKYDNNLVFSAYLIKSNILELEGKTRESFLLQDILSKHFRHIR